MAIYSDQLRKEILDEQLAQNMILSCVKAPGDGR